MKQITRRTFLKHTSLATGALATFAPHSRALGANDDLRVAVVGFNSQGQTHLKALRELAGVRVVALCDCDRAVLNRELAACKKRDETVAGYTDIRKLLESRDVDAITTATPDHWHALATIWACQAGKDVYVEKPVSYCLREGRKMVEAARKYKRIVQVGNAEHSHATGDVVLETAKAGKIRVVYSSLNRLRQSIGKVTGDQPVPDSLDYNLWLGPAPMGPLRRKKLHYDWHWVWPTGTGELGNNGIYPLDAARLALGQKTLPKRAMSFGGRFLFDDDGETPNTQIALFQYDPGPLIIFELRNFPSEKGPKTPDTNVVGERGDDGLPRWTGLAGDTGGFAAHKGHIYNFVKAVRSRNVADLRMDVLEGHLSTAMVHMANISYRLGRTASAEAFREAIKDRGSEAAETYDRFREHLAANGVDWTKTEAVVGPWLELDAEKEQFVGGGDLVEKANQLVTRPYRSPFVVPENV
ncbi:MAG TPA: Gfo/Idh/MocA family oxidoreductase [Verrucomicrobiae bacterium]